MFVFQSLAEVRQQTGQWLEEYNEERPHESLGHLTLGEYLLTENDTLPEKLDQGNITISELN